MSDIEELFAFQLKALGFGSALTRELRFHPVRMWRFDFADVANKIAIEIEGGLKGFGRHQQPKGFADDCEKYNEAALLGWMVLRVTPKMVATGQAFVYYERALALKRLNTADNAA